MYGSVAVATVRLGPIVTPTPQEHVDLLVQGREEQLSGSLPGQGLQMVLEVEHR